MKDLHPIIRKFWEDMGYEIRIDSQYICAYKNGLRYKTIAFAYVYCGGGLNYRMYNQEFTDPPLTEQQMLRLIALKTFL